MKGSAMVWPRQLGTMQFTFSLNHVSVNPNYSGI